ncbi:MULTISPECIES: hypothetical protein [Paenibacillus]|uniref:Uncharacterized protein n=1 Tax=Paenibacillus polymyxa TaxID=1406 RepID=A0AAP4A1S3_PAEPO|nr:MULTISPECIES: hypothetical protein [Paenibacillus]AIW42053.1 hypothetical protein X809_40080 [Paenibacillus polymyxa CR1]APB73897.1 hypothetical protein PPYC2_02185 [Paenibacillus polymyxa]MCP3745789.1 hypothetical protein [Paenibacillus sp. A3M_27_13]MDH2331410.1 hypothetical protein [Paenibacillus polymyxa]OMF73601.1 hypothetical protein BK143_06930 [Paenibacillus peoriae]
MRVRIFIFILIIGIICVPAYFIMSSFGLFQNEKVLVHYKLAIEVKDKKYDAWPLISSYTAIDKKGDNRQLYYQAEGSGIEYLFQLAYGQYELRPSKENPFLDGGVHYTMDHPEYVREEKQYENANDYTELTHYYNQQEQIIYTYNPKAKLDKTYVRSIITAGMTRTTGRSSRAVKDDYINISKLFKDKLGVNVKVDVDEDNKIVTLSMT